MVSIQWLFLLQIFSLATTKALSKVPAIIIFGDSSMDTGNNNYIPTLLKSDFSPYGRDFKEGKATGRFSNGRLTIDFVSEAFGLPPVVPAYLDPDSSMNDFEKGVCFASAGTGYDNATSDVLSVLPLWKELEYFKEYIQRLKSFQGEEKAEQTLHESLFIVSMGTNDFLENYYAFPIGRSLEFTIDEYQTFLASIAEGFVRDLHTLGARKIDVTGLPPMGCLPLERARNLFFFGDECNEEHNLVAFQFNGKLSGMVDKLNKELDNVTIVFVDVYGIIQDVVNQPMLHGFETSSRGCCGTGLFEMSYLCNQKDAFTCSDANKYVFWDAIHPSEKMNYVLADHAMKTKLHIFL